MTLTQFKEKTNEMAKNNYGPKTNFVLMAKCVRLNVTFLATHACNILYHLACLYHLGVLARS